MKLTNTIWPVLAIVAGGLLLRKQKQTSGVGDPFSEPFRKEAAWRAFMRDNGYESFTTFYSDMSIADRFGGPAVIDTYKRVMRSWGKNIKYITEFCMVLNHKIWEHYNAGNEYMAKVYDQLWSLCQDHIEKTFTGEDLQYYYRVTD